MSAEFKHEGPVGRVEQALAALTPTPPQIDRDRLMFLAGQASAATHMASGGREPPEARPSTLSPVENWLWPASTATLAATSLALAIALFARPATQPLIVVRDAHPTTPAADNARLTQRDSVSPPRTTPAVVAAQPAAGESYLKTREVALRMGLDALGTPQSGGGSLTPATTYLELLAGLAGGSPAAPAASPTDRIPNM